MAWAPNAVIAERYVLEAPLGQGGMGSVWIARHATLGSKLAVKQIDAELCETEAALQRFRREAKVVAGLRSPHIVQVFDHGLHEGVPFIAMELLEGESLAERLDRSGKLSPNETLRIVTHVGRALTKAHEAGVVHRDLKPDNVFLVRNEDEALAKVIDFGIAKSIEPSVEGELQTQTGTLIGTPHYMSPEQARAREVDHRTDLWALGVLAFECLTGARPFFGKSVSDVLVSICSDPIPVPSAVGPVPEGFDAWFAKAVRRDPEERFASAKEMAAALRGVVLGAAAAEESSGAQWTRAASDAHTAPTLLAPDSQATLQEGAASSGSSVTPAAAAASVDTNTFDGVQRVPARGSSGAAAREAARPARRRIPFPLVGLGLVVGLGGFWLVAGRSSTTARSEPSAAVASAAPGASSDVATDVAGSARARVAPALVGSAPPARASDSVAADAAAEPAAVGSVAPSKKPPSSEPARGYAARPSSSPGASAPATSPKPAAAPSTPAPTQAPATPKDKLGF